MISIKQGFEEQWSEPHCIDTFWQDVGFFQPFAVDTQEEKDYMFSLQMVYGRELPCYLHGVDEYDLETIPITYLKIDLSSIT